jgi:hypothetical protein
MRRRHVTKNELVANGPRGPVRGAARDDWSICRSNWIGKIL